MNDALFRMSISDSIEVCQACGVYKGQCCSNEERKFVMPLISCIGDYSAYVKELQSRGEYDILLADESMFQFNKSKKETVIDGKGRNTIISGIASYSLRQSWYLLKNTLKTGEMMK